MGCVPACLCRCGQLGCGCHRSAKDGQVITLPPGLAMSKCHMCERPAPAQTLRSPRGRVVVAIWCGGCDVATPKP